jgi:hypothetical protein
VRLRQGVQSVQYLRHPLPLDYYLPQILFLPHLLKVSQDRVSQAIFHFDLK